MHTINFKTITKMWKSLLTDPDSVTSMKKHAPSLEHPTAIHLKKLNEGDGVLKLQFYGFVAASNNTDGVPMIKRVVVNWIKQYAADVKVIASDKGTLLLNISTQRRFDEAAVTVFRRDPKTNKVKRVYKCIGGRKDGRRVSDGSQCLQYPNVEKRISLSISKRAKAGQAKRARTKTKLTNIVAKRVRKANNRLKKARGF